MKALVKARAGDGPTGLLAIGRDADGRAPVSSHVLGPLLRAAVAVTGDRERLETERTSGWPLSRKATRGRPSGLKRCAVWLRKTPGLGRFEPSPRYAKDLSGARRLLRKRRNLPRDARVALQGVLSQGGERSRGGQAYEKTAAADPKDPVLSWELARPRGEGWRPSRAIASVQAALRPGAGCTCLLARLFECAGLGRPRGNRRRVGAVASALRRMSAPTRRSTSISGDEGRRRSGDAHSASLKFGSSKPSRPPRYQYGQRQAGVLGLPLENWTAALAAGSCRAPRCSGEIVERSIPRSPFGSCRCETGGHGRDLVFGGPGNHGRPHRKASARRAVRRPARTLNGGHPNRATRSPRRALSGSRASPIPKTPLPPSEWVLPSISIPTETDLYVSARAATSFGKCSGWNLTCATASALPEGIASRWAVAADFPDRDGADQVSSGRTAAPFFDNLRGGHSPNATRACPGRI